MMMISIPPRGTSPHQDSAGTAPSGTLPTVYSTTKPHPPHPPPLTLRRCSEYRRGLGVQFRLRGRKRGRGPPRQEELSDYEKGPGGASLGAPQIGLHRRFIYKGTRAHTHRELIREWLWETMGGFHEFI